MDILTSYIWDIQLLTSANRNLRWRCWSLMLLRLRIKKLRIISHFEYCCLYLVSFVNFTCWSHYLIVTSIEVNKRGETTMLTLYWSIVRERMTMFGRHSRWARICGSSLQGAKEALRTNTNLHLDNLRYTFAPTGLSNYCCISITSNRHNQIPTLNLSINRQSIPKTSNQAWSIE